MEITHIVAVGTNGVIGAKGLLPWNLPEDLQRFKSLTMNHTLIMGRKTYKSLPKPLLGRRIIVLSTTLKFICGAEVAASFQEALALCSGCEKVFVAGGEEVYKLSLPFTNLIYLTSVDLTPIGDAFYPLDGLEDFVLEKLEQSENPLILGYMTYTRTK